MRKFYVALFISCVIANAACSFAFGKPHPTIQGTKCVSGSAIVGDVWGVTTATGMLLMTGLVLPSLLDQETNGGAVAVSGLASATFLASTIYGAGRRCPS